MKITVALIYFLFGLIQAQAQEAKLVLPIGHTLSVQTATFSPDGKWVLSSGYDGTVKIWEAISGKLLVDIKEHNDSISYAAFSSDGKRFVTASFYGNPKIWDVQTSKEVMSLKMPTQHSNSYAAFSPDGKKIVVISSDNAAVIFDAIKGVVLTTLKGHNGSLRTARFSFDSKRIVTAGYNNSAEVWDINSGKLLSELKGIGLDFSMASFSHDNSKIITVSGSNVWVWNVEDGKKSLDLSKTNCTMSGVMGSFPHWLRIHSAEFNREGSKIVTAGSDQTIKIWDATDCRQQMTLRGHKGPVTYASFSPDDKKIVSSSQDNSVRIWDVQSGKLIHELSGHTKTIIKTPVSPNGQQIMTLYYEMPPKIWDTNTGNILFELSGHRGIVLDGEFSRDGKKIVTSSSDSMARVWDAKTGQIQLTLFGHKKAVRSAVFSPDGRSILTSSNDETIKIWDSQTGVLQRSYDGFHNLNLATYSLSGDTILAYHGAVNIDYITLIEAKTGKKLAYWDWYLNKKSNDGTKIIMATRHGSTRNRIQLFDSKMKSVFVLNDYYNYVKQIEIFPDNERAAILSGGILEIWNIASRKLIFSVRENSVITSITLSADSKRIYANCIDNISKSLDAATGNLIYSFFAVDNIDHFTHLPSGYYQCTPAAAKLLHYVTKDLKVITFEQLDVKYNRPDKVLEAIGNTDTALINSYRKAWEKRIKKLGIDTTAFRDGYSVPEADFVNRDNIEYEQKNGTLKLHIKGIDSTYKLDRFNIWINEAPLFGQRGISIKKRNRNDLDTTITVKLSQGENRIETSITNVNGTESYRMPLFVNYTPAIKQKESLHFIGIGMDKFADSKYDLQYSSKDIRDLAKKLKEKYKENITIDTLFNENVSTEKVKALKQKLQNTSVNDKVIISYSGHGMLSKDYNYYLSTYSVNFNQPEENGLPYDELENLLDSIPARKKLMLIDACHSGEVDKEEKLTMQRIADSLGLSKGIDLGKDTSTQTQHLGLKNSFELMQSLFVNVGKSTGATIISAAAGNQFALERNDLKNGVFTYSILEAMNKNQTLKISELKKMVGERVEQLTNGLQKPTSRNENIAVDWSL